MADRPITPGDLVKPEGGVQRVFLSIDVACSACGAQPGQRCTTRNRAGVIVTADISHNVRAKRADEATKRWAAWHGDQTRNAELPPL